MKIIIFLRIPYLVACSMLYSNTVFFATGAVQLSQGVSLPADYDKDAKPFGDEQITVNVTHLITDLLEIDENRQTVTMIVYLQFGWVDPRLVISERIHGSKFLGVGAVDKIWIPGACL